MFYVIVFSVLAILLVIAGVTVLSRRRTALQAEERHSRVTTKAARKERKAERAQSRHARRKRK
jgi:hypothetical protein